MTAAGEDERAFEKCNGRGALPAVDFNARGSAGCCAVEFVGYYVGRAVVNGAAVQLLKASNYTECQETICFLQTVGNAGKKFDTPDLDDFFHLWSSLFSHSCAAPPSASGEQQDQMPPSITTTVINTTDFPRTVTQRLHGNVGKIHHNTTCIQGRNS